jgi:dTDP-glucose pyrophosphorylase
MNIVIPMAGLGSRFADAGYSLPKPLIDIDGEPMIAHAIKSLDIEGNYYFLLRKTEFLDATIAAINKIKPNATYIVIDDVTEGAAVSVLKFKEYINNDDELIVANCDQIMAWDAATVLKDLRRYDGAVVTINDSDPKHSYIALDANGQALCLVEKKVISSNALTGIHYWRHGRDFVASAEKMIDCNDRASNGEFYVAPTYNYMLTMSKLVGAHQIKNNEIHFVGTPADLDAYNASR